MHQLTVIEPKWLQDVAPTFFKVADANKICELGLELVESKTDRQCSKAQGQRKDRALIRPIRARSGRLEVVEAKESYKVCEINDGRSILLTSPIRSSQTF